MKQTKQDKQTNKQTYKDGDDYNKWRSSKLLVHFRFEFHELQLDYLTVRIVFFL